MHHAAEHNASESMILVQKLPITLENPASAE
jgi:hypothetical protein